MKKLPNDWYRKNQISGYEEYYSSIFYCYFTALGLEVCAEDTTNHGQIDMSVVFENRVYIFEFKVVELAAEENRAIKQIKSKNYHEKYMDKYEEVYILGVEFSKDDRNIVSFEWEKIK